MKQKYTDEVADETTGSQERAEVIKEAGEFVEVEGPGRRNSDCFQQSTNMIKDPCFSVR